LYFIFGQKVNKIYQITNSSSLAEKYKSNYPENPYEISNYF